MNGRTVLLALAAVAPSCATGVRWVPARGPEAPPRTATEGTLRVVTYNVHGLPRFVAKRDARETHPKMGAPLSAFDLVLVQEDFWYHDLLDVDLPWSAGPRPGFLLQLGDGLARWSRAPLSNVEHVAWRASYGITGHYNDRLAAKGFAAGTVELAPGVVLWVYNVHFDAGGSKGDRRAKELQREQLAAHIERRVPEEAALLVAGDFNAGPAVLEGLCARLGLVDAGVGNIDRILYRSGEHVQLWVSQEEPSVKDLVGLSDHSPVALCLGWRSEDP